MAWIFLFRSPIVPSGPEPEQTIDHRQSLSKMPHSLIAETWSLEECSSSFWSKGGKFFKTLSPWTKWVRGLRLGESRSQKPEMYSALRIFPVLCLWALGPCCLSSISTSPLPSTFQDISKFFLQQLLSISQSISRLAEDSGNRTCSPGMFEVMVIQYPLWPLLE